MIKNIDAIINECITRHLNEQETGGIIVYRGMDKEHKQNHNIWLTDSEEYAAYWAKREYNTNGTITKYILPNSTIQDLCNQDTFEEIMNEYEEWQDIPDDSPVWENNDTVAYDLMHDLCFPSKEQITILKNEGYKGIVFKYFDDNHSILIFNGKDIKPLT